MSMRHEGLWSYEHIPTRGPDHAWRVGDQDDDPVSDYATEAEAQACLASHNPGIIRDMLAAICRALGMPSWFPRKGDRVVILNTHDARECLPNEAEPVLVFHASGTHLGARYGAIWRSLNDNEGELEGVTRWAEVSGFLGGPS